MNSTVDSVAWLAASGSALIGYLTGFFVGRAKGRTEHRDTLLSLHMRGFNGPPRR